MTWCTYRNLPESVLLFSILVELYSRVDVSKNASYSKESRESKYEVHITIGVNAQIRDAFHRIAMVIYHIERAITYLPQLLHVPLQISSILRLADVL